MIEGASLPPAGDTQYSHETFGNLVPTTFHAYFSKGREHMWEVQEESVGHLASSICSIACLSICLLLMTVSRALPFSYIILSFCNPYLCIYLFICHLTSYSLISKILFIQLLCKVLQEKQEHQWKTLFHQAVSFLIAHI